MGMALETGWKKIGSPIQRVACPVSLGVSLCLGMFMWFANKPGINYDSGTHFTTLRLCVLLIRLHNVWIISVDASSECNVELPETLRQSFNRSSLPDQNPY